MPTGRVRKVKSTQTMGSELVPKMMIARMKNR